MEIDKECRLVASELIELNVVACGIEMRCSLRTTVDRTRMHAPHKSCFLWIMIPLIQVFFFIGIRESSKKAQPKPTSPR